MVSVHNEARHNGRMVSKTALDVIGFLRSINATTPALIASALTGPHLVSPLAPLNDRTSMSRCEDLSLPHVVATQARATNEATRDIHQRGKS